MTLLAPRPESLRPTLLGFLAILLWSVTVGLARSLSEKVGPLAGGAAVYLIGGALCWAWVTARRLSRFASEGASPESPMPFHYLLGCGSLFVLYLLSFYLAIGMAKDRVQVLGVGLANYLWPTLTIVFSLALLRRKAGWLLVPGTAAALAGVFLAMAAGAQVSPAELLSGSAGGGLVYSLAAAGAVMWALYSNLTSRWMGERVQSGVGPFMLTTGVVLFLVACLRLGAGAGPLSQASALAGAWTDRAAAEALGLGLATAVGYECWETAMRRGDVTLVAAASYFTPLLSTLFSCLYLGVRPGASLWVGCGLVVAGSLLSWRAVSAAPAGPEPGPPSPGGPCNGNEVHDHEEPDGVTDPFPPHSADGLSGQGPHDLDVGRAEEKRRLLAVLPARLVLDPGL